MALPYEIVGLKIDDEILNLTNNDSMLLIHESIESRRRLKRFYFNKVDDLNKINPSLIRVLYKYPGQDRVFSHKVYPFKENTDNLALDPIRMKSNIGGLSFINIDEINKVVSIKSGKHVVKKTIIVPSGYVFKIQKDTEIILREGEGKNKIVRLK